MSAVPEIDVDALAATMAAGEVALFDVREPDEYQSAHVEGAVLIPLGQVVDRVGEFPTSGPVHVICKSGGRSMKAAEFLIGAGVEAINIAGGTMGWIDSGQPVVTGSDAPGPG